MCTITKVKMANSIHDDTQEDEDLILLEEDDKRYEDYAYEDYEVFDDCVDEDNTARNE